MKKKVIIVGGGTAGWLTASYLAKILSDGLTNGLDITLIESPDIGIIGVGEGTFPSIRKTFSRIGLDEETLIREASATYKQGIRFINWRGQKDKSGKDDYLHPFQIGSQHSDFDLLPYWLLGVAGDAQWDDVNTVQKTVIDNCKAPKQFNHSGHDGPLGYAYHFDATELAVLLRRKAVAMGVRHLAGQVENVVVGSNGYIERLETRQFGDLKADLYIDCTGLRAQLISGAMGVPFHSYRNQIFANRAVAVQVPYAQQGGAIQSQTIATAQECGWTWDIGLGERRGVGYVFSTDHTTDERAEAVLRSYLGPIADNYPVRFLNFEAGVRETPWKNNCIAIGMSAGFIEPLEATGIGFAEISSMLLSNLFPWENNYEVCAKQFNAFMRRRFENVVDFIKLHYCLNKRTDTDFWRDNVRDETISDGLKERLERWRYRPPGFMDMDPNFEIFTDSNWQYVLYGMGYKTDISAQAGVYKYYEDAKKQFANIRNQANYALSILPSHRELIERVRTQGFSK